MANTYLSKTFGSAGNQKTFTWSGWIRACGISSDSAFFQSGTQGSTEFWTFNIQATGGVYIQGKTGSSPDNTWLYTNAVKFFKDPTAWQHWVVAVDTTQSTNTNRIKVYVNGTQFSDWLSPIYPSQNFDTAINNASVHTIGARTNGADSYFNGSMSHIHFIDGTAYDASAFGETDATTGIWKPKVSPSVTYGTNGFFLKFNEGALGTDSSPNGNNFTVNGSLTPAKDTPDNVYATLNPLDGNYNNNGVPSLSNGNLVNTDSAGYKPAFGTLAVSKGKWYYEYRFAGTPDSWVFGGWGNSLLGGSSLSVYRNSDGQLFDGSTYNAYGASYSAGDIIGVAFDYDNDQITFYKNGVSQGTATSLGINTDLSFPMVGVVSTGASIDVNFGNGYFGTTPVASAGSNGNGAIFEFDCPNGYYALNTKNINTYG